MSNSLDRLFSFWQVFEFFQNLPEVDLFNEQGEESRTRMTNERLERHSVYTEPYFAFKSYKGKLNVADRKRIFFCRSHIGVIRKKKIVEKVLNHFGANLEQSEQDEKDRIENEWLYLFSVVANSDNKIIGVPIDVLNTETKTKATQLAVRVKPFWFYLSNFLKGDKKALTASALMEQVELFNERLSEKFKSCFNTYSYWVLDTSFIMKLAEFWDAEENPFLYYLKKSDYNLIIGIYNGVIRELDELKDKGGRQGNEDEKEKRKKLALRGLGWINQLIRTNEYTPKGDRISGKHIKIIPPSHELFRSPFSKIDFIALHRKLKPESNLNDVDEMVIRIAKYVAEYDSPDNIVLLTTDTTMSLYASELGVFSTGLLPQAYEREQKGLNEQVAKEMVKHFIEWMGFEDILSVNDFEYSIVSSGKAVEKDKFFGEVYREVSELPSFFVSELDLAKKYFEESETLKQYILGNPNSKKLNPEVESLILSPENIPPARWLTEVWAKPFFNQALALSEIYRRFLKNTENGIVSVNGPPGTGKTTILRDVVANVITQRAYYLAKDIIEGKPILEEDDSSLGKFYKFTDERLCDYNIVVASSNNKAVENVSKELPLMSKVTEYEDIILNEPIFTHFSESIKGLSSERFWCPISVALGNKRNLTDVNYKYIKDLGMMLKYLWKSKYSTDKENREAEKKGEHLKVLIKSIDLKEYARDFLELYNEIEEIKRLIPFKGMIESNTYSLVDYFNTESTQYNIIKDEYTELSGRINLLDGEKSRISISINEKEEEIYNYKRVNKIAFKLTRVPIIRNLSFVQATIKEYQQMRNELNSLLSQNQKIEDELVQLRKTLEIKEELLALKANVVSNLLKLFNKLKIKDIESEELNYLSTLNAIYNYSDREKQLFTPYAARVFEEKRKNLFFKAVKLHYAFVLKYRQEIKHNIDLFFRILDKGGKITNTQNSGLEAIINAWTAFAFITPVISTTFHSVTNMFVSITKPNTIGFVIVDEAGQGIPYYAAGLLMRAKRAVIVGDPLQIEPVVTIPESLRTMLVKWMKVEQIAKDLNINLGMIVPGMEQAIQIANEGFIDTSVQVLADRASSVQAIIERDGFKILIGIPLRVHFRCKDPAFSIANTIAYGNTMIHGADSVRATGKGYILHVDTDSAKWTKNISDVEIEAVNRILDAYKKRGKHDELRNVYIISPFVGITLENIKRKLKGVPVGNIGTVHAFQGKENKIVVILLGGASSSAIKWAIRKPNLLNVAVTRSKEEIVVVGDVNKWIEEDKGIFAKMISFLKPVNNFKEFL